MGSQNSLCARKGCLEADQDIGPRKSPQRAGRGRDRYIEMSGKFRLPAHI